MELVLAYDRLDDLLALVREYTNQIRAHGAEVSACLEAQGLDQELADISSKYAMPYGRLYLALVEDKVAGCIALTPNDVTYGEVKRLYVRPEFRGLQIGSALLSQVIADAKSIGYKHIRLDTFPFMKSAIRLYEDSGFYPIERYNQNPAPSVQFFQLDL